MDAAPSETGRERRQRLLQFAAGAAFLAVAAVLVAIVLSAGEGEGGDASDIQGAAEIDRLLDGIPQRGLVLGDADAEVRLVEYGDLQCPACKAITEEVLEPIVEGPVRHGETALEFRNFTILGRQSEAAAAAALAAGAQGRGWSFIEIFYRNQGLGGSGYADDEFLAAVARAAGVEDMGRWNRERSGERLAATVEQTSAQARELGFSGTPSFAIEGPRTGGLEPLDAHRDSDALLEAIEEAG
jgi:protein-disulfide isomerase